MIEQKQNIICLMGPTASGKSDLALKICDHFNSEIISVDSAMVYQGMDIGTAKPTDNILKKYPHHLINIKAANENYSVAQFLNDAMDALEKILTRQKLPLFVGGTMMYFNILQKGLVNLPSANPAIRLKITAHAHQFGWEKCHEQLMRVDPISAHRIHPHDPQRLLRALEVYELTGKPMSLLTLNPISPLEKYNVVTLAIAPHERATLHQHIAKRFYQMLEMGFIEEVNYFYQRDDMHADLSSMRSVGYRQVWEYLDAAINYDEMIEKSVAATRQLAKRQLTWLRHWQSLQWFDSNSPKLVNDIIQVIAKTIKK